MKSSDAVEELAASLQRLRRLLHSRQVAARTAATAGVDVSQQGEVLLRGERVKKDGRAPGSGQPPEVQPGGSAPAGVAAHLTGDTPKVGQVMVEFIGSVGQEEDGRSGEPE